VTVRAASAEGKRHEFRALVRIDTPQEVLYYRHGGILQYVLRQLLAGKSKPEVVGAGISTQGGNPRKASSG
jgi:aconitate hydratase